MPVLLDTDFLSLDFKEKEIAVPVDALDRSKGTVTVTIREIPYAVKRALSLRVISGYDRLDKARTALESLTIQDASNKQIDTIGEAFGYIQDVQLEYIKWGVAGHRADDFLLKGVPVQFESVATTVAGVSYQVVSPKTMRLYMSASGLNNPNLHTCFLANLAFAVREFQEGRIITPDDVWQNEPTA